MKFITRGLTLLLMISALCLIATHDLSSAHSDPSSPRLSGQSLKVLSGEGSERAPTTSPAQGGLKSSPEESSIVSAQGASKAQWSLALRGSALNLSSNTSDQVTIKLSRPIGDLSGETFIAEGAFGGRSLFGRFKISGRQLPSCNGQCLLFHGELDLGGQGGWPVNTYTSFTISLVISPHDSVVRGVYHIGDLATFDYHQYGQLTLRSKE